MFEILIDAKEFKESLEKEIPKAKDSVFVQAMTFEGDEAGEWLINLLINSTAEKKHLCIDSYSKFVINDAFIYSPKYLLDRHFREEVINTKRIIKKAQDHGVTITFTNPLGLFFHKYPFRNHKKLVVIDEKISYLGGINFSDHNFQWHDFMAKIKNKEISRMITLDFNESVASKNQSLKFPVENSELYFLDGFRSKDLYKDLFHTISSAKKSIDIFSPYISDPLLGVLKNDVSNNITINLITPEQNNKSIFKSLLKEELKEGYFHMNSYQGEMSHLKAIFIDRSILIFGSSNFDFVSYYCEQEVVMVSRDKALITQFIEKILEPDLVISISDSNDTNHSSAIDKLVYALGLSVVSILGKIKYYFT